MPCYVRFHEELTEGPKADLTRSSRFVFMELALKAKKLMGAVPLSRNGEKWERLHKVIGGNIEELKWAVVELEQEQMIEFDLENNQLLVPNWQKWNASDSSAERMAKHRKKAKQLTLDGTEEDVGTKYPLPPTPAVKAIMAGLDMAKDLIPESAIRGLAERAETKLGSLKLDRIVVGHEMATGIRAYTAKYPDQSPASRIVAGDRQVDWLLRDLQTGKRPLARPQAAPDEASERKARLQRELEAARAKQ